MAARKSSKSSRKSTPQKNRKAAAPKSKASSRGKGSSRRKTRRTDAPRVSLISGLSLDRRLDLLGVGLTLIGLLTFLSLLSSNHGSFIGIWVLAIKKAFGWGMYLLPLTLVALGLWLILRRFDRFPQLALERAIGLILIYLNLLTALHFFIFPENRAANFAQAAEGQGGGYVGGIIFTALRTALGWGGTAVALVAWLLIALALTLDVSVLELFAWAPPLFSRIMAPILRLANRMIASLKSWLKPLVSFENAYESIPPPDPIAPQADQTLQPLPPLPTVEAHQWVLPPIEEILEESGEVIYDDEFDRQRARVIEDTLASFGAPAKVVEINRGPTITQFGVEPGYLESRGGQMRVRVSKISSLADDLALALAARRIRIQAPVPSKGFIGIEVPNEEISLVALGDVIDSEAFKRLKSSLRIALGQDVAGNPVAADLTLMPHLLIAGATGSGKSVSVNSLICCLLLHNTPDDLRIIMVDPKRVELTGYNGIPHLLAPVVVELERVVGALQWVAREMDQRYHKLAQAGARNIKDYNNRLAAQGEKKLPYLLVVIDELADLMMLAPDETERTITRLAQLARATGIHLVISTQRPSVDVVTGLIKANFPARIAFAVASGVDSRVILDQPGAERLLGSGDMLFQAPDAASPVRLQGTFVSDVEIQRLVHYWRGFYTSGEVTHTPTGAPVDALPPGIPLKQMELWEEMVPEEDLDPLFDEAVDLVRRQGRASISMLQRRLRIGYTRAARLIETMQRKEIVGPTQPGTQGLEVLDYGPAGPPAEN
ncbi:MAG: DNA translocase FtsK 4TM domain-containing protein [Anaerolineales bacterium]|jgi:S-DNA-T family DNA segregation ATPase FtsK/SpoIIIE